MPARPHVQPRSHSHDRCGWFSQPHRELSSQNFTQCSDSLWPGGGGLFLSKSGRTSAPRFGPVAVGHELEPCPLLGDPAAPAQLQPNALHAIEIVDVVMV